MSTGKADLQGLGWEWTTRRFQSWALTASPELGFLNLDDTAGISWPGSAESLLVVSKSLGQKRRAREQFLFTFIVNGRRLLRSGARKWRHCSWVRGTSCGLKATLSKEMLMTPFSPRRSCTVCEYQDFYKVTLLATHEKVSKFSWSHCAHTMPHFRKGFCPRLELCCH